MTAETMQRQADAAFWDRIAPRYARDPIRDMAGYTRTLDRVRGLLGPGDEVLELGCGTGTTAMQLAPGVAAWLGTDIAAGMVAIARDRLAAAPVPGLAFRQATAEALAAEGRRFDVVAGFNLLHLVRDLPGTLAAMARLVRPGGLLVTKTPCLGDMNPLIRLALPPMRLIGRAPHVTVLRADALQRAIAAAGFEVIAVERHGSARRDTRPFIVARRPAAPVR